MYTVGHEHHARVISRMLSASNSVSLIFTRSYLSVLLITTLAPTQSVRKTSLLGYHISHFFLSFSFGSIAVGLEVIEEGAPLDTCSDSGIGHYMGNDVLDTRKCILEIQQLNRRVRDLERNMDTNSVGFWSKIAFFAFTIINPILLHWLFWKRR